MDRQSSIFVTEAGLHTEPQHVPVQTHTDFHLPDITIQHQGDDHGPSLDKF